MSQTQTQRIIVRYGAHIINPAAARPRNVTAALLGDPPPGRREQLAAMLSPYYSAGNISGKFAGSYLKRRKK